jgi:hypothetical protein
VPQVASRVPSTPLQVEFSTPQQVTICSPQQVIATWTEVVGQVTFHFLFARGW